MNDTGHNHLEIEVKFYLPDPDAFRTRLLELGASGSARVFESNQRYDDRKQSLRANGRLLRLRQDRSCRLTFKQPPERESPEFKIFRELEVEVGCCRTMEAILEALGFTSVQVYEKWRETFSWSGTLICIDTMPFGTFAEIEGAPAAIKEAARQLDLPWAERILLNYLAIFDLLRDRAGLPFEDVTFENFQKHPVDIAPWLPMMSALEGTGKEI